MKRTYQWALLAAMVAFATLPGFAQSSKVFRDGNAWVEEITGTISAPASLRVDTDMGAIHVQGGARKDVSYVVRKRVYSSSEESARRLLTGFMVTAARHGDAAVLEGTTERRVGRLTVDFQIQAPRTLQAVRTNTEGGNISLANLGGRASAQSGGGSISLQGIAGEIAADTGGGSIEVADSSNLVNLRTGGGAIKITGAKGKVNARTGGGNITVGGASEAVSVASGGGSVRVEQCGAELHVSTGGGNINVGDVNGRARLETGGGNIRLASARGPVVASTGGGNIELYKLMQGARAETGAGPITAEFLGMTSDSSLQTSVGDVIVYISPQARMTVRAELAMANGHHISSDFPELKITGDSGGYGPQNYHAEGSLNGGGPVLSVRTMSGNIEFRRAK